MKIRERLTAAFQSGRSAVGAAIVGIGLALSDGRAQQAAPIQKKMQAASFMDRPEDFGWRRLTGDLNRELLPLTQDRMIEIAYWLWETNPMAGWLIEIAMAFIVAEGLPYEAKNEDVKKTLDDFWYDPLNRMDLYLPKHIRESMIFGELLLPAFVAPQTGKVRLGYIDPARIQTVYTDPENAKIVIGVELKEGMQMMQQDLSAPAPIATRSQAKGKVYKTILPNGADSILSKEAQALREGFTDGQCFYFSFNNVSNSPRGRSDFLRVADWLDAYEQFLYDYADKWPLMNVFAWDMTVDGGDKKDIEEQMKNFTKKSGSVFAHNEKVTLEAKNPKLESIEAGEGARIFRNHILGAMGYPEHWYGGGGNVNRATATEMDTPTYKMLKEKQRNVKYVLESILGFVVQCARGARYLKVTDEDAAAVSIITPELAQKDIAKNSTAVQQLTASIVAAMLNELIDLKTARQIFAASVGFLGIEIDVDAIDTAIQESADKKGYEDYLKRDQKVKSGTGKKIPEGVQNAA
jgi:hypothetical protein